MKQKENLKFLKNPFPWFSITKEEKENSMLICLGNFLKDDCRWEPVGFGHDVKLGK